VKAREIVVLGTIHGNVETSDKIDIRRDAKLVGDIRTARIVIEDGAYFKGNIDIIRAEAPRQEPKPAPKPQPVASATGPAPVMAAGAGDNKR
jgi:cytoskeletal protein CcmA (bactofilin family)